MTNIPFIYQYEEKRMKELRRATALSVTLSHGLKKRFMINTVYSMSSMPVMIQIRNTGSFL